MAIKRCGCRICRAMYISVTRPELTELMRPPATPPPMPAAKPATRRPIGLLAAAGRS